MRVRKIARVANVLPQAVLHYSRIGLLQPNWDPDTGDQVFPHRQLIRLRLISRAQKRGWSVDDIERRLPVLDP
ncbi:MAG: MerR family transcriptional regulator [Gammaproteobacteria bacterium]